MIFLPFETALISDQRLNISIFPLVSSNSAISLLAADWPQLPASHAIVHVSQDLFNS